MAFLYKTNNKLLIQDNKLVTVQTGCCNDGLGCIVTIVTTASSGFFYAEMGSSTGYFKVEWWDATSNVYSHGLPGDLDFFFNKAISGSGTKTIRIYSVSDSSGTVRSGTMNRIDIDFSYGGDPEAISIDLSTCPDKEDYLYVDNNNLTTLNVSGLSKLTVLGATSNNLKSIDLTCCVTLGNLYLSFNNLSILDIDNLNLTILHIDNNSLTSIKAKNVRFNGSYDEENDLYIGGADLRNNNLSAEALNKFYSDIGDAITAGTPIRVGGNPGVPGHNKTIAENKNYTVYE